MQRATRVLFLFVCAMALSADGQTRVQPTGIFSDMRYIKEAGDVVGTEIFVTYSVDQYWAQVQFAEGSPFDPMLVKANVVGNKLSFDFPAESPILRGHFEAELRRDGLMGGIDGARDTFNLKRRNSYWQ